MYKIIAMDFDDTILTSDKKISDYSKSVLKKLKNKGFIIVGVTGRSLSSAKNACDIRIFNYLILNNGAHIHDVQEDKSECISLLSKDVCSKVTNMYKDVSFKFDYCSLDNYYMTKIMYDFNKKFLIKINNLSEVQEDICKMNIFLNDEDKCEEVRDEINSLFDVNAFIMQDSSSPKRWVVINPKNIDKSKTLELLCNRLNLSLDDVIFFGDGLNDIELMESSGLGVAMGNALPSVQEKADDIALDNNSDGVVKYLIRNISGKDL